MLCSLMDGRARTSTELAVLAEIAPSTASVHLAHLKRCGLVTASAQGRHRYYSLGNAQVAAALEALMVVSDPRTKAFVSPAPERLRWARTCYDHMAGTLAVALHDRLLEQEWITAGAGKNSGYELASRGARELSVLGIDVESLYAARRRLACACIDWSERRPHLGGAVGAALLTMAERRKWVRKDLTSRALRVTRSGARGFFAPLGIEVNV